MIRSVVLVFGLEGRVLVNITGFDLDAVIQNNNSASKHDFTLVGSYGTAPQYLSDRMQYVADLPTTRRDRLRSSTSSLLDIRPSRLVTVGDRSFAAAGPRLWNSLPADVQSAPSLTTFRQKLKTHLFRQSYPDIVL